MRVRAIAVVFVVSSLLLCASVFAQSQHIVAPADVQRAVADRVALDQQNRAAVLGVFQHAEMRELAGRLGLNLTRAEAAVSTLDSADLARLAGSARAAETQLSGSADPIVISVTTLLLILIIVILLVR